MSQFNPFCKGVIGVSRRFFEMLLFEYRSVLAPAERDIGKERVKFSVKNKIKKMAFVEIT